MSEPEKAPEPEETPAPEETPKMESAPESDADTQDDPLNKAIEELRGVLHEPDGSPTVGSKMASVTDGENANIIMAIPVEVQIVLGSTEMPVSELMSLQKGATVSLNRRIGEPVDVVVNGRKIAKGEITVLEDDPSRFGIQLTEIIAVTGSR